MRKILPPLALALVAACAAQANTPLFTAECPNGAFISSEEDGDIIVNGDAASVDRPSDTFWAVFYEGVEYDVTFDETGAMVSYTAPGGANGMCATEMLSDGE
ncbi:hypothetical protein [Rubellimicrobium roseum]|uniref:Uncharacterized protein n=1 Tax=Rubellimicrobium roseum TaxID=687525 RepID=A0A5C4N723_9RHOB|nr:hypothetical protein [Rubellimicrobium roseum]TNC65373.1 hypothetical protein FHG71_17625 [Rubellimicrobium roseum]